MLVKDKQPALIVIDVQKGFEEEVWGTRNNLDAEENIAKLLTEWRKNELPIIHVQHLSVNERSPLHPAKKGSDFKEETKPLDGEIIFQKNVNSAFIGTNLENYLRENQIDTVVITGISTQHCVSTTTRMSGNLGFNTYIVSDGTAAFSTVGHDGVEYTADEIHNISLATLHQEFATVISTNEVLQAMFGK